MKMRGREKRKKKREWKRETDRERERERKRASERESQARRQQPLRYLHNLISIPKSLRPHTLVAEGLIH